MQKGQVWLSCLFGGIIGGALTFAGHLEYGFSLVVALPIGALMGGGIAYLWYDIAGVKQGLARAYREVIAWRPDWSWWWRLLKISTASCVVSCTIYLFVTLALIASSKQTLTAVDLVVVICFSLFTGILLAVFEMNIEPPFMRMLCKYVNPIVLPIWTLVGLVQGLWWCLVRIPVALGKVRDFGWLIGRFTQTALRYIHSQGRLIVMIATAIGVVSGVVLGLHLNNPLLGTLACGIIGAILGEIEYRFVSIRLLKLQPA